MASVEGIAAQVTEAVAGRIGGALRTASQGPPDALRLVVAPGALRVATQELLRARARFLITVGIDTRPLSDDYRVLHLFSLDAEHLFVVLECGVGGDDPHLDSITDLIPGANWSEREHRDAIGVTPDGHPDPRRLLLADDWPAGVYPLRRDFPYDCKPPAVEGVAPRLKEPPEGASVLPIGPFFPVLEEPSYWRLFVEGETVVGCDYRGFYNHRGIEKLGDSVLTYNEIPYLAERICGICGFIHSTCYCQAVEKAADIEVPRRARYIRSIMLELERVHSHLLWLGIAGHILGFDTVLMQTWRMREPVMWLAEEISGNRKTYGMNTIGGLRRDLSAAVVPKILKVLDEVERESIAVRDAIVGDTTLLARTKNVGMLTAEWARQVCVVGPPARGSGVPIDARLDHPYAAYDEVPPRLCTQQAGDTWSRVVVRVEELLDSIRQVREGLARLPEGEVLAEIRDEIPPGRIGISVVEAPRGEAVHFVMTGGENRPYRWRVRAPTYPNLQAMPAMIDHAAIADVPITLGSLDPCFSCTERVEAIDVTTMARRVYSHAELLAMSRGLTRAGGRR
jgi:Ni,Fe-hydrogenase III large subunit/Ni,Fe-hydrogenase III component G